MIINEPSFKLSIKFWDYDCIILTPSSSKQLTYSEQYRQKEPIRSQATCIVHVYMFKLQGHGKRNLIINVKHQNRLPESATSAFSYLLSVLVQINLESKIF